VLALVPCLDGFAEQVELNAAVALPGPHVGQRAPQLGVPQERGQVVEGHDHADVAKPASFTGPNLRGVRVPWKLIGAETTNSDAGTTAPARDPTTSSED
jgi:hypothetical protein